MDGLGPRGVPRPDMHHRGKPHEELKAMTDAAEPAASEEIAAHWRSMGNNLEDAGIALQQAVIGSRSGWTGQAADAMRYRLREIADWSMNTGQGFTAASSAVREQSEAVSEAKRRMPEPVPYDPGQIFDQAMKDGLFGLMALPQRLYAQKQKHDAAYNEAVVVVAARDGQLAVGAATIPAFTAPPVLSDDGGARPPDDGGRRPPEGGPGRDAGGGPVAGFGPGPGGGGPGPAGPATGPDLRPGDPGPGGLAGPDSGVTVSGAKPTGSGSGGTGGGLGQGAGLPGAAGQDPGLGSGFLPGVGFVPGLGFGSGGDAGPGGRASGPGSGGPGRGAGGALGPGGPGSAAAGTAAGGRGAAGARGAAGIGGVPMGAGGRGRGEEDSEHKRPTWLQEDDPDAVFGTDELTAPPVIGGEGRDD